MKPQNIEIFNYSFKLRKEFGNTVECLMNLDDYLEKTGYTDAHNFKKKILYTKLYIRGKDYKEIKIQDFRDFIAEKLLGQNGPVTSRENFTISGQEFTQREIEILNKIMENIELHGNKIITLISLNCYKKICARANTDEGELALNYLIDMEEFIGNVVEKKYLENENEKRALLLKNKKQKFTIKFNTNRLFECYELLTDYEEIVEKQKEKITNSDKEVTKLKESIERNIDYRCLDMFDDFRLRWFERTKDKSKVLYLDDICKLFRNYLYLKECKENPYTRSEIMNLMVDYYGKYKTHYGEKYWFVTKTSYCEECIMYF
jgi:hypothetical protein